MTLSRPTWTIHQRDESLLSPVKLVRESSTALQAAHGNSSSCMGSDRSVLEQNGLQATVRVCFNSYGICETDSKILFPTRFAKPGHPRGYLQVCLSPLRIAGVPEVYSYDGVALMQTCRSMHGSTTVLIYVSPSAPIVWIVFEYEKEQQSRKDELKQLVSVNGHNVWESRQWISPTRLQIAYTCLEELPSSAAVNDLAERKELVSMWADAACLDCPENDLCVAFQFAKIRLCEAIFDAPNLGRIHSPGGGMYYSGVWCNDQAEYAAPALCLLGGAGSRSRTVAVNSLLALAKSFRIDEKVIPYSVEIDGGYLGRLDRGDAAMFAWGSALVALTLGDDTVTHQLYPYIKFACDIIKEKISSCKDGIVPSESDELEGRFPTGYANLSANAISILALESTSEVSLDVGDQSESELYARTADALRNSVESHFGVDEQRRYQYYKDCAVARGWTCLAGLAGLAEGREAVDFVLSELWSVNGVLTSEGFVDVWDRCTLYAIRAGFAVGLVETSIDRLRKLVELRLKHGISAPYMVENNSEWAQLSSESGLFIRIYTEGLLGLKMKHGRSAELRPSCPADWEYYAVTSVYLWSSKYDFRIEKHPDKLKLIVRSGELKMSQTFSPGCVLILRDCAKEGTFTLTETDSFAR